ncbi:MAG: U32 family peptidase [Candidatus Margulisiibacteriota bacterium]|nr:U32 family peptidase [Candidatus Margulisiibacteriota bacterium]
MPKPELLIPAGNSEKLRNAVLFGADAVYLGAGPYSLRSSDQTSFGLKELKGGVESAHSKNVKVYLAMNIFTFDDDIDAMMEYLKEANKLGIDAVIISDVGLLPLIQKLDKNIKVHLSTQANTLNSEAVKFWKDHGVKRVVLGRELNAHQIKMIRKNVPDIELELFVHGAMCMSYSGRCLLSKHMTGRSANRGECTQPCRWEYRLKEVTRPEQEFRIQEDERGTYIMNSRDLCLIEHIPELIEAGINSFKIEGRMKSAYYAALVTKIYRKAIDSDKYDPAWKEELQKVSHRTYSTGFYFNEDDTESVKCDTNIRTHSFVGVVEDHGEELEVKARNQFAVGDELEIIDPNHDEIVKFKVTSMKTIENEPIAEAHNDYHVLLNVDLPHKASRYSLLRKQR